MKKQRHFGNAYPKSTYHNLDVHIRKHVCYRDRIMFDIIHVFFVMLYMVHLDNILKIVVKVSDKVNEDVKLNKVKDVDKTIDIVIDVGQQFTNDKNFSSRQHML